SRQGHAAMPKYAYVAQAGDGEVHKGVQTADSLNEARSALVQRELTVTTLGLKRSAGRLELTAKRLKRSDLMHLSRQLAAFMRAGIPILDAIGTLGAESDKSAVRRVMAAMGSDLRAGSTLSEAVDRHPDDFPAFYRGILRSAELTGRLDTVLDQLSVYLERDLEARRKIKSALIYPAIVAATSLGTVIVLTAFVLPKFEDFFSSLDAKLPLATRMLLSITAFLGRAWYVIIGLALLAVLGYLAAVRTTAGRRLRDAFLLKVPILGVTIRFAIIERFTRLLASMVNAGVPLPDAMFVATESLRNVIFEKAMHRARLQMIEGAGLAAPIAATRLFPGVAIQMIRVGENTGTLDTQLDVAATYYQRELDYKIKKLTTSIEPIVVLFMGFVVGFVAIALVSAMYGIFRSASIR
ncbi:MAG: type II secretion system F family protein, partial [Mycobacteriales bacterium]